ncbi:MAG: hypothetical protein PUF00_02855 [Paraprevotella sp.]|nr:hypothetical protein [Paraprevotella sp.]
MSTGLSKLRDNIVESTIQNLTLVSLMRGHDIQQDTIALSQYRKDKNSYYYIIISPTQRVASEYNNIDSLMDIKLSQQEALIDGILHINRIQELQELLVKLRVLVKVQKNS